jgi:hypothetical protein
MTAPAATTAYPNQYWAGKFLEADVATYFTANTILSSVDQEDKFLVIQSLTGAPNPLLTANVTVYNGKNVDFDSASTVQADMNTSLSIKWKDDAINNGGASGTPTMEYICIDSSNISAANLASLLTGPAALLAAENTYWLKRNSAADSTTGLYATSDYHSPTWTTTGISALGEGTVGGNAAVDNSYRYCKFSKYTAGSTDSAGNATGGPQNGMAKADVLVSAITVDVSDPDDTFIVNSGALSPTTTTSGLTLGSSYIFALRVSNPVGNSAALITTAKMVQGPAQAKVFKAMDYGALVDDTSAIFNIATQKFEIRLKTDIRTGAGVTDDEYVYTPNLAATGGIAITDATGAVFTVTMVAATGDMAQFPTTTDNRNKYTMPTTVEAMDITKTVVGKDILLTFDKVKIQAGTMNAGETATTYAAAGDETFATLSGMTFVTTLIATNTHGATSSGEFAFATARQVFGTKADYAALTTSASVFEPTGLNDVRTSSILTDGSATNYIISATLPVNAGAQTHGRNVDRIDYEVYQTRGNNTEKSVAKESVSVGSASTTVAGVATVSGTDYYAFDEDFGVNADTAKVANKFNLRVLITDVEMGYPLKLRVNYASAAAAAFGSATDAAAGAAFALAGQVLMAGAAADPTAPTAAELAAFAADAADDFVTAVADLTFDTVPTNQDDECGTMGCDVTNNSLTVHWGSTYMSNNNTLTGFRVELYDYATRTYQTKAEAAGNTAAGAHADAKAAPASTNGSPTSAFVVEKGANDRSCTFSGLTNGRLYVPIVRTKTTQGATTGIYSQGRTVAGSIGSTAANRDGAATSSVTGVPLERHTVAVVDKDDVAILSAARFRKVSDATADMTPQIFGNTAAQFTPFGTPIVTAVVSGASATQSLKIDDNGSILKFGAMLQTSLPANNAAFGAAGQISNATASGEADVFYLDLSFSAATYTDTNSDGTISAAEILAQDNNRVAPTFYKDGTGTAQVTYSARRVTTVGTDYLGANWATETNYVFVSNAAGTTAGKVSSTGTNGMAALS